MEEMTFDVEKLKEALYLQEYLRRSPFANSGVHVEIGRDHEMVALILIDSKGTSPILFYRPLNEVK